MDKAAKNKSNFELHKKLISEKLENFDEVLKTSIDHFAKTGKISGSFLLAVMDYAEIYHKSQAKQLEREQHGRTWDAAIEAHEKRGHVKARSLADFDEYFDGKSTPCDCGVPLASSTLQKYCPKCFKTWEMYNQK